MPARVSVITVPKVTVGAEAGLIHPVCKALGDRIGMVQLDVRTRDVESTALQGAEAAHKAAVDRQRA